MPLTSPIEPESQSRPDLIDDRGDADGVDDGLGIRNLQLHADLEPIRDLTKGLLEASLGRRRRAFGGMNDEDIIVNGTFAVILFRHDDVVVIISLLLTLAGDGQRQGFG